MNSVLNWSNPLIMIVWVFGWAAFVLLILFMNHRKRQKTIELIHKERMTALEKGIPMPEWPDYNINGKEALAECLKGEERENPRSALGVAAILVMLGVGISLFFYLWSPLRQLWSVGLIIVFLGLGFVLSYLLTKEKKD